MAKQQTLLDKDLIERICTKLRTGVFPRAAMESEGISDRNYHYWRKRGRDELDRVAEKGRIKSKEQIYVDFLRATDKANAESEVFATLNIRSIAKDAKVDARTRLDAEKFFLSSRHRENWGPKLKHEHTGEVAYEVVISEPLRSSDEVFEEELED